MQKEKRGRVRVMKKARGKERGYGTNKANQFSYMIATIAE